MNQSASKLGKLAAGVPKNFSIAERQRRREQMTELNKIRSKSGQIKGSSADRRKARRKAR